MKILQLILDNPIYPLLILVGVIVGVLFTKLISRETFHALLSRANLIKTYWKFVIVFTFLVIATYALIFITAPIEFMGMLIEMAGQVLSLIFAIFVGWYAFLQVAENRTEKSQDKAHKLFVEGSYRRAEELYEKVYVLQPEDFINLAELLELHLVIGDYTAFVKRIDILETLAMEDDEQMLVHYLRVACELLKENLGTAKDELKKSIECAKDKPRSLLKFDWRFDELKSSESYKNINGEPKVILDNFILYLQGVLSEKDKVAFESGNYILQHTEKVSVDATAPLALPS